MAAPAILSMAVTLCRLISGHFLRILRFSSGMIQLYLRFYYPLIYLGELATAQLEHQAYHKAITLAFLAVAIGVYRSIVLYFPWIHIWTVSRIQILGKSEANGGNYDAPILNLEQLDLIDVDYGLSTTEASRRLDEHGKNVLWDSRNWFPTTLFHTMNPGNLLSEVSNIVRFYRLVIDGLRWRCLLQPSIASGPRSWLSFLYLSYRMPWTCTW